MSTNGLDNSVFNNNDDLNRIEVIGSSSYSDLNSTGSQHFLTDSQTNYRFTTQSTKKSDDADCDDGNFRVPTPSNVVRRWSQNISKIGKTKHNVREKTIYRLPSRKVFAVDGHLLTSHDLEINRLASEIEQNDYLMEDSASGKQIRMDTIRALPHSLTAKRMLKEKLAISITQHQMNKESNDIFKVLASDGKSVLNKTVNGTRNIFSNIELWYESMKEIEGHFGSGVGTYFKFLRWLFTLNSILLIFTFGFITLPQILYDNLSMDEIGNVTTLQNNSNNNENNQFRILDLLTAEGYIKSSILFYGAYTNMSFALDSSRSYYYSIPHAYFMTMLCLYLCTFVIISSSMARSYRKSFIETSGGVRSMFAHKIFCSWDFSISNMKAAKLKQSSIYNELKEDLNEFKNSKKSISKLWKCWMVCSQLTAHILVGAMICGLGYAMWILLKYFGQDDSTSPWQTLYLSIAVNILMLILQNFFSWISTMEDYRSPRRTLHITLMRNFILEAVIIGVLLYFWLTKDYKGCWETSIGQEIYRLMIIDFVISAIVTPIYQLFHVFILSKFWPALSKPEFDISRKSLGLVFNQTLLWVGLLFSPLLVAVIAIKMILIFYIKKLTLIYLCKSPTHLWRSAQTQTLYLVFTFISLLGVIVALGYIMTQVPVSAKCGPFRGYNFIFQIFIDGVLKLKQNHWIWRAIMTIARPAVLGGILLTMTVAVYYLRSKSKARGAMVKLLKDMLYMEARDKEFLLMNITKVTQQQQRECQEESYQFGDEYDDSFRRQNYTRGNIAGDNYAESCTTWRYQRQPGPSVSTTTDRDDSILRSRHI